MQTEMRESFAALAGTIKERSEGKKIVYVPNAGNFGDGLIRYATKRFFFDHDIAHFELNVGNAYGRYLLTPYLLRASRYFFIFGGGGAWGPVYYSGYRVCRYIAGFTSNAMILPSTYACDVSWFKGAQFRRDQGASLKFAPKSSFCHDMALYLYASGLGYEFPAPEPGAHANMFRTDGESAGARSAVAGNKDVSAQGNHMSNGDSFLGLISPFASISTDRLHVAIAGAILNRRVTLHVNNYFKIKAIYEASLQNVPNIILADN